MSSNPPYILDLFKLFSIILWVSGVVYIKWQGTWLLISYRASISWENVYGFESPFSILVLLKSMLFFSILGGVPVFNLIILNPYDFNLSLKCIDGFSPFGPLLVLVEPLNISALR